MTDGANEDIAPASKGNNGDVTIMCAQCGTYLNSSDRLPATTKPDTAEVYLFCSDDCRTAWLDEEATDESTKPE